MITIGAGTLSRLVAQTKPHIGKPSEAEAIQVITFDYDGHHLHAMATNRYTLAVSRTQAKGDDKPWTAIVDRQQLPELAAAVALLDKNKIDLEISGGQMLLTGPSKNRVAIDLHAGNTPIDWRKLAMPALERKSAAAPMAMTPAYFGAWKNLPGPVRMWSSGANQVALILAADFLGLQMPVRATSHEADGFDREIASWKPATTPTAAAA